MAKLTLEERAALVRQYRPGEVSMGDLAKRYKVAPSSVSRCLRKAKAKERERDG